MVQRITKAIIPVAGLGTRFLPASKTVPKELFPVIDKPIIHYVVEEAVKSGIKEIIFITKLGKHILEDYFDRSYELEYFLRERGKVDLVEKVKHISKMAKFYFIRQDEPKGTGDAVLRAKEIIGNEPCAIMYGDEIIDSKIPALKQIFNVYEKYGKPTIAIRKVSKKLAYLYGIIKGEKIAPRIYKIEDIVEKPKIPFSDLAVVTRYIIPPEIFGLLEKTKPALHGEIWLTDALKTALKKQEFYACEIEGDLYDSGSKIGYLEANIVYGMKNAEIKRELKKFLKGAE